MKIFIDAFRCCVVICFLVGFSYTGLSQIKQTAQVEGITQYVLDNGLKVLLFPDNSAQTITVNITYLVGSRHEGYGEKGMAHLLEHMLFKGTPSHPDIPKELTEHGARPNGTTWYDRTNYFETFNANKENLEWALDLEADRMLNSYVAKKDLESEFSVVRNEFESGENSPSGVLMDKVISAAFLWHNYGNSTIGNRSDIERVPIENLQAFYKKYYRPDNAVLMVTGKFETQNVLNLIEEKFKDLKNPEQPLRDVPTIEPAQDGEKRVTLSRVGDLQIVSALYHTPSGSHEDYSAIVVAEEILTSQPSGRLYKALIDGKKASSVWSFLPFTKEPGFIYFNVDVPSDMALAEAEATLKSVLEDLKANPVTEEEVKRAKSKLMKKYDQIFRNSGYLGTFMSEFIGAGDWRLSFITRDRVEAMTAEKVNAAMQRYFINTNRTIGNFVPSKTPTRVEIEHTAGLDALVTSYKGKEGLDAGEAFDVSYENIQNRLKTGELNGLPIEYGFIKKDNRGKTVTLSFVIRNGKVDDFMNKGQLASFTARMLNKGTQNYTRQEIEDKLSELKSSIRFSGSNGRIVASISSTEDDLIETIALMTEMLKNPKFDSAELEKLKTQDLASIEENKTEPQFLASKNLRLLNQNYPKGHPLYVSTIEEDIEDIKAVSVDGIKEYYDDFYGISNNASLVAIGNIDEEELKDYFEKAFADFRVDKPYESISNPFKPNNEVNKSLKTPDKKNAISIGVMAFEGSQDNDDYGALQIASSIFGGGVLNSRITTRLRQQDGVSYGAGGYVNVDADEKDKRSAIVVYAIYAPENALKVQRGFKEEIERFINDGITEEELKIAVNSWVQGEAVSRAKDNELSTLINNNLYYDRDMMFQKEVENKVTNLTVDDVNKVIKKYFKLFDKWTVVNAGDFVENKINTEDKKVD
ncbi:insulinase family protein [Tamlana fucoidanivorans]|uniref:Insulinase family protein n=1 Tax=Allotamlana fucoidanivorans TaxID=2583814 RepID=A0A5C4SPB9_9FLAO|nr:pitrilysin family protein [Tamlana fucoidanivorans]TNJ46108.1 insulinase family protein [Tamlana fucoidanivorans]